MAKINLDKAQNVNITAKRGDDFNLALEILNEDGSSVQFKNAFFHQQDGTSGLLDGSQLNTEGNIAFPEFYYDNMPDKRILLFTITDMNYNPVLMACNERVDVNSVTNTEVGTVPSTVSSRAYAKGIAKHLSRFANGNTVSARHHYGVEATGVAINTVGNFSIITTDEDRDTSIFNSSYEGYAVKGVISNADVNNGNHSNKIKVAFKNSDFLLQPGSYKYTFRAYWSLRETAAYSETPYTVAFRKTKTYLTGKLKVTE